MAGIERIRVAIVDYGLGNLFSVKHACAHVGMEGVITSAAGDILGADAVFLPGVGGFGDAMNALRRRDLVRPLQDYAASGKPLIGICLGLQLFDVLESNDIEAVSSFAKQKRHLFRGACGVRHVDFVAYEKVLR